MFCAGICSSRGLVASADFDPRVSGNVQQMRQHTYTHIFVSCRTPEQRTTDLPLRYCVYKRIRFQSATPCVFPQTRSYIIVMESGFRSLSLLRRSLCVSRAHTTYYCIDRPAIVAGCLRPGTRHILLVGYRIIIMYIGQPNVFFRFLILYQHRKISSRQILVEYLLFRQYSIDDGH